jgi:DNA-binding NtrC family response regulator
MKVLLADDEKTILITLQDALEKEGYEVKTFESGKQALEAIKSEQFHVIICDIRLPECDGHKILQETKKIQPDAEVILITAYGTVESAVKAMKDGAYDYIQKPFRNEEVIVRLKKLEEHILTKEELRGLKEQLSEKYSLGNLVAKSKQMKEVFELIKTVSESDCTVLIEGESGTGKELVSEAIHYNSPRRLSPLVKVFCSAVPETLIESELFGHEKGAFTDAKSRHIGKFERANRGTIFIDDVDDLSSTIQVKLLRVLEYKEFERLGGEETIRVDVRIIAATKKNLWELVKEGKFREDLFYRLNVIKIVIPPLRERPDDVQFLIMHFLSKYAKGKKFEISPETMFRLVNYYWPGNVRELEHCVQRAVILAQNRTLLYEKDFFAPAPLAQKQTPQTFVSLKEVISKTEAEYITNVLKFTKGRKTEAAQILGITRKNLWEKIKHYNIQL